MKNAAGYEVFGQKPANFSGINPMQTNGPGRPMPKKQSAPECTKDPCKLREKLNNCISESQTSAQSARCPDPIQDSNETGDQTGANSQMASIKSKAVSFGKTASRDSLSSNQPSSPATVCGAFFGYRPVASKKVKNFGSQR